MGIVFIGGLMIAVCGIFIVFLFTIGRTLCDIVDAAIGSKRGNAGPGQN